MNKVNFDSLTNYKAPENWIKNAAAIPETVERKPAVVPFWKSRALVTAASLVLVSALSLLLYLSFGVKPPVEVKPSSPATEIVWSTDENGETVATEIVIVPDGTTVQNGTLPTEEKSDIERINDQIFGSESTSTTTATGRGRTNPTTKTTSPDNKTNSTESGRTNPTTKSDPAEDDPVSTEAPASPTDPPVPTQEPEIQVPTEAAAVEANTLCITAAFPADLIRDGETIYCAFWSDDFEMPYTPSAGGNKASYTISYGKVHAEYDTHLDISEIEGAVVHYAFYNSRGVVYEQGTVAV